MEGGRVPGLGVEVGVGSLLWALRKALCLEGVGALRCPSTGAGGGGGEVPPHPVLSPLSSPNLEVEFTGWAGLGLQWGGVADRGVGG